MTHHDEPFADTRALPEASTAGRSATSDRISAASRRSVTGQPEALTDRSLEVLGTLRDEAMTVEI
ncbi:MAG: hypothetical protein EHM87_21030, partial [Burkholderiales bacterium]